MRIAGVLIAAAAAALGGCHSAEEKYLRHHIEVVQGRVATIEQSIEQKTGPISATSRGLDARASFRPLVAWTNGHNARPPAQKTIKFRQTGRYGRIAGWDDDCWQGGQRAWYVEIDSSTATKADLLINNLRLYHAPGQVTLRAGLDLDADSMIHWHIDATCWGGGFGDRERLSADARGPIYFRLALLPMQGDDLPYRISAVSPTSIEGRVTVDLGFFGKKSFPFKWNAVAETLSEGTMTLLVDQDGEVGPLPNGQTYTYRLRTVNPQAGIQGAALRVTSDLAIDIDPALVSAIQATAANPQ